jgi:DNA-binding Xre family transcriptional regulator
MGEQTTRMHPDQIVELRRAARERRMAWARRPLVTQPTAWSHPPEVTAATVEASQAAQRNERGWSVNIEPIDRERLLRGWTQRELARRACVDQGTLSDLLARRRRPTLGTVQALCTTLRLTLAQVITFDAVNE